jgi:RNA polymerase sigma factor (sigma-70 family)
VSNAPSLYTRHLKIALAIARDYWIGGFDREDVAQEARIALWIAAREYDPDKGSFPAFARTVISRHLGQCLKHANRQKRRAPVLERDVDVAAPETDNGQLQFVLDALPTLTDLERSSLADSLNGVPITTKRYDNALQRARRKLSEQREPVCT